MRQILPSLSFFSTILNASKKLNLFGYGVISLLVTLLFTGQYYDPEDGDRDLFVKHKPTFQQYFYSPVAYHRFQPTQLTLTEEIDEKAFQEFIRDQQLLRENSNPLLPMLLIQLTLTLLVTGFVSLLMKTQIGYLQLIILYLLNLVITSFGLAIISVEDNAAATSIVLFVLLALNALTAILITKAKSILNIYNWLAWPKGSVHK